jgi:hypothetical protein
MGRKTNNQIDTSKNSIYFILRKYIHSVVAYSYKFDNIFLLKIADLLLDYHDVQFSSNKNFLTIEFFISSINKNLLKPIFLENSSTDAKLKISLTTQKNIIKTLYMLSYLLSKDYPAIQEFNLWEVYAEALKNHIEIDQISNEDLDTLMEIFALFENSISRNSLKDILAVKHLKRAIQKRLEKIQDNAFARRKNLRTELETMVSFLGGPQVEILSNEILKEKMIADLLITKKGTNQNLLIIFYTFPRANPSQMSIFKIQNNIISPLRERILSYKGYKSMFINISEWINTTEFEKKQKIEAFLK